MPLGLLEERLSRVSGASWVSGAFWGFLELLGGRPSRGVLIGSKGYLRPLEFPGVFWGLLVTSETSWGLLGPVDFWDLLELAGACWGLPRLPIGHLVDPPGVLCLGSLGASCRVPGPPGAFWDLLGLSQVFAASGASWGPLDLRPPDSWSFLGPSGCSYEFLLLPRAF